MSERPISLTYKTPTELGFTQQEFDALAWFVEQYDSGQIVDVPARRYGRTYSNDLYDGPPAFFDMRAIGVAYECGTAGCILGTIGHRVPHWFSTLYHKKTYKLFFGFPPGTRAKEARDATVRFLRGLDPWCV